jgi:NTE family protein
MQSSYRAPHGAKTALVLSGGSVKGAYQAGVLKSVLAKGFRPDKIYGVSVGALNGLFLTDCAGKQFVDAGSIDWPTVGQRLWDFWSVRVNAPGDLVKQRNMFELFASVVFGRYNGFVSTDPLKELVMDTFAKGDFNTGPTGFTVGVVDLEKGVYLDIAKDHHCFLRYAIASTAIPLLMPIQEITEGQRKVPYQDGGIINVTPLSKAIRDGAEKIVVVMCQPEDPAYPEIDLGRVENQIDRVLSVMNAEVIKDDIKTFIEINEFIAECESHGASVPQFGFLKGKKKLELTVIRPKEELKIDIRDFSKADIEQIMQLGTADGERAYQPLSASLASA